MQETIDPARTLTLREQHRKYAARRALFFIVLVPVVILLIGLALSMGSADLSFGEAYSALLHKVFPSVETTWFAELCVWKLRLPRIMMGFFAGIALGMSGCVMQGVLRNPLADPYMLGIASSAGFGASLAIIFGTGFFSGQWLLIGNAFLFSLLCSAIILFLSSQKKATPETMILTGIAMMFLFSAMTTILQYFAESEAVKAAVFWMVGDLGKASWQKVAIVAALTTVCTPLLIWKSWDLNAMALGDEDAISLGVRVERSRIIIMVVASLLVAGVVCFTGTIGFIGLVAPHICRMVIGSDNRVLLPASGMVGAVLLVAADTVARTVMEPVILPVGAVTAFLGIPLFVYLIMRRRREHW